MAHHAQRTKGREPTRWTHDETPAMWPEPGIVPGSSSMTIAEG